MTSYAPDRPTPLPATLVVAPPAAAPVAVPAPVVAAPVRRTADPAWVRTTATATGVPEPAMTAYADAVLNGPTGCGLGWSTLAGIGWVESQHGTVGGRSLDAAGRPSSPVIGPPLDGAGFAAIPADPAGTALHGDPIWDHAVGPLQFLPTTWATWGRDGDGDGLADPQDLDDAAAAAAAYLCGAGADLATDSGWTAGIFAYNHSDAYVQQVSSAANTYAERAEG